MTEAPILDAGAVLLHAPTGRDAALIRGTLERAGYRVETLGAIDALWSRMSGDCGVVIVAEEALVPSALPRLIEALAAQPSWSDLPVLVLTTVLAMQHPSSLYRTLRERVNVTLLERPVHPTTLLSAVEAALRARRRQYEVRDYLVTRERAEEHARQVQKMEAVGQLAGGVAHEVNNMMTVVLGFGEFALRRVRRAEETGAPVDMSGLRGEIEEMVRAGRRSAAITQQLLTFSRRQRREPVRLRLQDVVGDLEKLLGRLVGASIEISLRLPADLPVVQVDRTQLEQVLINLVINARDAIAGPGRITISGECVRLGRDFATRHGITGVADVRWVQLSVSDTGHGMDRETRDHAFEPFFTTKPVGEGTGLGLSTAYGIIKQSGGYIWLYSEPGLGTTVKIFLPECDGTPGTDELVPASARGRGETVLVVEDEPVVRRLVRSALEEAGYAVLEAGDGVEALTTLRRTDGQVKLVLSDVVMPRMGGQELARELREERPGLPLLFMSGYQGEDVTDRGLIGPGEPFMQKPFAPEELARRVRAILDGGASNGSGGAERRG
ncbi:MAG TPA: response regulator [Gemmatimonadales bacterium]